jgi:hypothetical protein
LPSIYFVYKVSLANINLIAGGFCFRLDVFHMSTLFAGTFAGFNFNFGSLECQFNTASFSSSSVTDDQVTCYPFAWRLAEHTMLNFEMGEWD